MGSSASVHRATVAIWSSDQLGDALREFGLEETSVGVRTRGLDGAALLLATDLLLDFADDEGEPVEVGGNEALLLRQQVRAMRRKSASDRMGKEEEEACDNIESSIFVEPELPARVAGTSSGSWSKFVNLSALGGSTKVLERLKRMSTKSNVNYQAEEGANDNDAEDDDKTDYSTLPYKVGDNIPPSPIFVNRYIGSGMFGHVYIAEHRIDGSTPTLLAMKACNCDTSSDDVKKLQLALCEEAALAIRVGVHPNVVTLRYVTVDGDLFCSFSDLVDGQELGEMIGDFDTSFRGPLFDGSESDVIRRILGLWIQLARGLKHLHNQSIMHEDVKPANLLVTAKGNILKIADFGMSSFGNGQGGSLRAPYRGCTPRYRSPEIAEITLALKPRPDFKRHGKEWKRVRDSRPLRVATSDMWAFGLVGLQMYAGGRNWAAGGEGGFRSLKNYLSGVKGARMWNVDQVEEWVQNHIDKKHLPSVLAAVRAKSIDGEALLNLHRRDLRHPSWGVPKLGGQARVFKAIERGLVRYTMPAVVENLLSRIFASDISMRPESMDCVEYELMQLANEIGRATDIVGAAANIRPPPVRPVDLAITYGQLGRGFRQNGDLPKAISMIQLALEGDIHDSEVKAGNYQNLGIFLGEVGRTEEAVEALEQAQALASDNPEVALLLGNAYLDNNQPLLAISAFKRGLELKPSNSEILYRLASAFKQAGQSGEAAKTVKLADENAGAENDDSSRGCVLFNRAVRLYNDEHFDEAEADFLDAERVYSRAGETSPAREARKNAEMCREGHIS